MAADIPQCYAAGFDAFFEPDDGQRFDCAVLPVTKTTFIQRGAAFVSVYVLNNQVVEPNAGIRTGIMVGDEHGIVPVIPVNTANMNTANVIIPG